MSDIQLWQSKWYRWTGCAHQTEASTPGKVVICCGGKHAVCAECDTNVKLVEGVILKPGITIGGRVERCLSANDSAHVKAVCEENSDDEDSDDEEDIDPSKTDSENSDDEDASGASEMVNKSIKKIAVASIASYTMWCSQCIQKKPKRITCTKKLTNKLRQSVVNTIVRTKVSYDFEKLEEFSDYDYEVKVGDHQLLKVYDPYDEDAEMYVVALWHEKVDEYGGWVHFEPKESDLEQLKALKERVKEMGWEVNQSGFMMTMVMY